MGDYMDFIVLGLIIITFKIYIRYAPRTSYNTYLNSPQWRRKRQKVLARDLYQCRQCGSRKRLHVHHLTYKNLYHEPLHDLITLCAKYHKKVHAR
jgi:5-methylcytosine-specific restriction endonuclease McrA